MKWFWGRKGSVLLLVLSLLISPAYAAEDLPPLPKGPLLLTTVTKEMLNPGYWINRLPDPDKEILSPSEMKELNDRIRAKISECVDVFKLEKTRAGKPIRDQLKLEFDTTRGRILFDENGKRIEKSIFDDEILPLVKWETVPSRIKVRWGAAMKATSVRALPTDRLMIEEVGDVEFDQIQFTLIKLWTPVAIYHTSTDGNWMYVQSPYSRGWVRSKDIALFDSREALKEKAETKDRLVVTGESVKLYADSAMTKLLQRPTMGTVMPLAEKKLTNQLKSAYVVWFPLRSKADGKVSLKKAFINSNSDVSMGFLPYTQRLIIRQAFKLLAARYGWGGMFNGRDCSGFIHDVFMVFGMAIPRNSKPMAFAGTQIDNFDPYMDLDRKAAALRRSTPAVTLLQMPKHIMIYLGEVENHFYVIHSTWAERINPEDDKRRINQVVVSDLSLNERSKAGSLFDRVIGISELN